mmetsp:Transcript_10680/g.29273  ORF Transcript_10680/g.29273 Transcript_10680/m.29273 type:complete len:256 (+) Transcript_10680:264-1031(+)
MLPAPPGAPERPPSVASWAPHSRCRPSPGGGNRGRCSALLPPLSLPLLPLRVWCWKTRHAHWGGWAPPSQPSCSRSEQPCCGVQQRRWGAVALGPSLRALAPAAVAVAGLAAGVGEGRAAPPRSPPLHASPRCRWSRGLPHLRCEQSAVVLTEGLSRLSSEPCSLPRQHRRRMCTALGAQGVHHLHHLRRSKMCAAHGARGGLALLRCLCAGVHPGSETRCGRIRLWGWPRCPCRCLVCDWQWQWACALLRQLVG